MKTWWMRCRAKSAKPRNTSVLPTPGIPRRKKSVLTRRRIRFKITKYVSTLKQPMQWRGGQCADCVRPGFEPWRGASVRVFFVGFISLVEPFLANKGYLHDLIKSRVFFTKEHVRRVSTVIYCCTQFRPYCYGLPKHDTNM